MDIIASAITDLQRLARTPQRARWARCALALLRAALAGMPLVCAMLALVHGQPRLAALELAVAALAAGLAWAARPGELCRLAWLLLSPHVARRRHTAAAAAAAARVAVLAQRASTRTKSIEIISAIVSRRAKPIINNRHIAHVAVSPKLISQRPN